MQKFAIITTERTGSNHLCALLDSHPEIQCHLELYNPEKVALNTEIVRDNNVIKWRDSNPLELLDRVCSPTDNYSALGFKIFFNHHASVLEHIHKNPEFKIILLERENILAQYSSLEMARQSGQWIKAEGNDPIKIYFNPQQFENHLNKILKYYRETEKQIEESGKPVLHLKYHELGQKELTEKLSYFLGVSEHSMTSRFNKQHSSNILDRFINQEDVKKHLDKINKNEWASESGS